MSTHASRAGIEGAPRMDWEVLRAADAIVEIIVGRDTRGLGEAVADRFRQHLLRVSERMAAGGDWRDTDGNVCRAKIWAYFNAGTRRELLRIIATTPTPLDDDRQRTAAVWVDDDDHGEDRTRARIYAFITLIVWAASLRRPVGIAVLARACGASYDVIADLTGVQRNTLIKAVGRAFDAAPQVVHERAQVLLPKHGSRPRGRPDAERVLLCAAVLDGYNAL